MRYVKVLLLAILFFLCLVFLFQNQISLSQKLTLQLNLLAFAPMKSIELPFYFIVLVAFLVGAILSLLLLLWDRMRLSARSLRANWRSSALESENKKLIQQMEKLVASSEQERPSIFARFKNEYIAHNKKQKEQSKKLTTNIPDRTPLKDTDIAPDPDHQ